MKLLKWQWFDVAFGDPYREGRTPALLLLGIYLADRKGKPFTKGKVCAFACVDHATTGPKFIYRFQEHGLITVSYRPGDRRRQFLHATNKLHRLVESELDKLQSRLCTDNP